MKRIILLTGIALFSLNAICQTELYDKLIQKAEKSFDSKNFISAFIYFDKAKEKAINSTQRIDANMRKSACQDSIKHQQKKLENTISDLKSQRETLNKLIKDLEDAKSKDLTNLERIKRDSSRLQQTYIELKKSSVTNKRLRDAFYFYDGKLALNYKDSLFGFIDTNGIVRIAYKYIEASQFNNISSRAKVKRDGSYYLIDTIGNELLIYYEINKTTNFDSVQIFELNSSGLSNIPKKIFETKQLQILTLRSNFIKKLPKKIERLDSLVEFDLGFNYIKKLPKEIGELDRLQILNLESNQLKKIPAVIGNLNNLRIFNLSSNELIALPDTIGHLSKLNVLNLYNNPTLDFASVCVAFANYMRNIKISTTSKENPSYNNEELLIIANMDSLLVPEISEIKSFISLDLSHNHLKTLAPEIYRLTNLEEIDLSWNQLKDLHADIGNFTNLNTLILNNNNLTSLPPEIKKLEKLKFLNLKNNSLSKSEQDKIRTWFPNCDIHF